ncbi:MAG TPA: hypothetical protein VL418_14495 [Devosiaceae bacterium]|nr:hypothetical protein [Devosiaceae bacterium]
MNKFEPLARIVSAAGLAVTIGTFAAPAFAGPAEIALLKSYEGNWRGRGQVVGTDSESVTCRMSLTEGNDDKVNYAGRCALAGSNLSINGTLAYIEASSRYEGAMTSNADFSGVAVGQKVGNGIVFNLKSRGLSDSANVEIATSITLSPGVITVNFRATDVKTGRMVNASVPFQKI